MAAPAGLAGRGIPRTHRLQGAGRRADKGARCWAGRSFASLMRVSGPFPLETAAKRDERAVESTQDMATRYDIIIPTLNAARYIAPLIESLRAQTLPPGEILIADSDSGDDTVKIAESYEGVRVLKIEREEFDHGGTRDMAIRACASPFFVLMTQDALPMDARCMEALLAPMADARVAAVCARQVARPEARDSERAVRAFRYSDQSRAWGREDVSKLGIRAYLLSDVCAAYRREDYLAVDGFERPIATNEDMLIAADLLKAGYRLAYSAEARVWHSHDHTLRQEYERNRLIGGFLARYGDRFDAPGELGEGARMVREISAQLLRKGEIGEWIRFGAGCATRLLGNRAGRRAARGMSKSGERSDSL